MSTIQVNGVNLEGTLTVNSFKLIMKKILIVAAIIALFPIQAFALVPGNDGSRSYLPGQPCTIWREGGPMKTDLGIGTYPNKEGYCTGDRDIMFRVYELETAVQRMEQKIASLEASQRPQTSASGTNVDTGLEIRVARLESIVTAIQSSLVSVINLLSEAIRLYSGR